MGWVAHATPELDRESRWRAILATTVVFTVLMIGVVALRFWIRRRILHKEDWLTLATMVQFSCEMCHIQANPSTIVCERHLQCRSDLTDTLWPRSACGSPAATELAQLHAVQLCLTSVLHLRLGRLQVGFVHKLLAHDQGQYGS